MTKNKTPKIICAAALILAGFMRCIGSDVTQSDNVVVGQGTDNCGGTYYALAKMTNSSGSIWIVPPSGTHTGTFTNASGLAVASSVAVIRKSDETPWCANATSITFPATNSSYQMIVLITGHTPPPTNGQPLMLQVTWQ